MEDANGVGPATHAGEYGIRHARAIRELSLRLPADHRLQLANQVGIRMRADSGSQQIVGPPGIRDPVLDRCVDGGPQGPIPGSDRDHGSAKSMHAVHVGGLSLDIHLAHVDHARQPQAGTGCGCGHAMLSRTGLRDDPPGADRLRKEPLTDGVVDLVGAGVGQVLAFHPHFRTPPV